MSHWGHTSNWCGFVNTPELQNNADPNDEIGVWRFEISALQGNGQSAQKVYLAPQAVSWIDSPVGS